ncbi:hypothetical protein ScPMuIL_000446 [Solemya velum]
MVYAFIIHNLIQEDCRIIYSKNFGHVFNQHDAESSQNRENEDKRRKINFRQMRKQQIQNVSSEVHSEYQFRRSLSNGSVDDDLIELNTEDSLPELELGFFRIASGSFCKKEHVIVWIGAEDQLAAINSAIAENERKLERDSDLNNAYAIFEQIHWLEMDKWGMHARENSYTYTTTKRSSSKPFKIPGTYCERRKTVG